jgi:hypothetical protein
MSFEVKDGPMHELYEERREAETSPERKLELEKQMAELAKTIPVPEGAGEM